MKGILHRGTVHKWHDLEGWGVLDAPELGSVWAFVAELVLETGAPLRLLPGQQVWFTAEAAEQDGHHYRAVAVWTNSEAADPK